MERIVWLHGRITAKAFPNAEDLARAFELSPRTAQRIIAYFRDRLDAPLKYDHRKKGYYFSDENYVLPLARVSQEEVLTILLARSLLDKSSGGYISRSIQQFSRRLMSEASMIGFSWDMLEKRFSAVWNLYSPAQADVFQEVLHSLLNNRVLTFDYTSPLVSETIRRETEPHHLQHYMGSWVLIAFCLNKNDWRKFYLSRMNNVKKTGRVFTPRPDRLWKYQVEDSFGIFQKEESCPAVLRFNAFRAGWIREQVWHPSQKMRDLPDGSLELEVPVADFREIKLKILSFGADVEVVSPEELRREVSGEIEKMKKIYRE